MSAAPRQSCPPGLVCPAPRQGEDWQAPGVEGAVVSSPAGSFWTPEKHEDEDTEERTQWTRCDGVSPWDVCKRLFRRSLTWTEQQGTVGVGHACACRARSHGVMFTGRGDTNHVRFSRCRNAALTPAYRARRHRGQRPALTSHGQLTARQGAKSILRTERGFSTNGAGTAGPPCAEKQKQTRTLLPSSHRVQTATPTL